MKKTISLKSNQIISMNQIDILKIAAGSVWVTVEDNSNDYILNTGDIIVLKTNKSKIVLQALVATEIILAEGAQQIEFLEQPRVLVNG